MDELFLLPGPVETPPEVLRAVGRHPIGHRGPAFAELYRSLQSRLQRVFGTAQSVTLFPSSGTGALEAMIVNLFSPGDTVVVGVMGQFGLKTAAIAEAFGLTVHRLEVPWGDVLTADQLAARLDALPAVRGVIVTHNETSTGATLDLPAIAAAVRGRELLLAVDSVSGVPGLAMQMDAWGVDAVATASQKAFLVPPGLGILALGARGWQAVEASRQPRFYWDLRRYQTEAERGLTPWTPATTLWFGLDAALQLILAEGLAAYQARHRRMSAMVRAGASALGLRPLAAPAHASPTVTALELPAGVSAPALLKRLAEHRVQVAGGLGPTAQTVVRVGHMGGTQPEQLLTLVAALEESLLQLGQRVGRREGVRAALAAWEATR